MGWSVLHRFVTTLTRSRLVGRALFGGRFPTIDPGEHYFDVATIALIRKARSHVGRGARVLDMGTGSAAVIGLWLWRNRGCAVTCTDVHLPIARRANSTVARNAAPLDVVCCRLFAGLRPAFDVVIFNPPYVPTSVGRERGLPEDYRSQWDGGHDGVDTISAFADAFALHGGSATALMGVNRKHVPRTRVRSAFDGVAGVSIDEIWKHPFLPVDVYVLVRRKSPMASTSSPDE